MAEAWTAEWLDVAGVNAILRAGGRWNAGRVTSIDAYRIGTDFGFSGRVYRLRLSSRSDRPSSLVAKFEDADSIAREVALRDANGDVLADDIPLCYGTRIDTADDDGVILLEDVHPAVQGDDAEGCTAAQATEIVRLIARLHAHTWNSGGVRPPDSIESWSQREWEPDRWIDRLTRASSRFPDVIDADMSGRLAGLSREAAHSYDRLQRGPRAWVHRDPHPDNVLWRPDGRLVMLDWSNAQIAPPAIDVAVLLSTLSLRSAAAIPPEDLLTGYTTALSDNGTSPDADQIRASATDAVRLLIRASIGWAGRPVVGSASARFLELQAQSAVRAKSALRWLDE